MGHQILLSPPAILLTYGVASRHHTSEASDTSGKRTMGPIPVATRQPHQSRQSNGPTGTAGEIPV
jgi:hypothetical protein